MWLRAWAGGWSLRNFAALAHGTQLGRQHVPVLHFFRAERHFPYISLNMGPLSARTMLPPDDQRVTPAGCDEARCRRHRNATRAHQRLELHEKSCRQAAAADICARPPRPSHGHQCNCEMLGDS
jgi:hypothetical protein